MASWPAPLVMLRVGKPALGSGLCSRVVKCGIQRNGGLLKLSVRRDSYATLCCGDLCTLHYRDNSSLCECVVGVTHIE